MVKKFTVPCNFGGGTGKFDVWIGNPSPDSSHPLQHQANWLQKTRGGIISSEVMESFAKLLKLSEENGVEFEELCVYALKMNEEKKMVNEGNS